MNQKLLLFDLDGTLLRNDKTISENTLTALMKCRKKGMLIGISTSRSEQNILSFIAALQPDIMITSGGALVKKQDEYIYKAVFTPAETKQMIRTARDICGEDCEIAIDTMSRHFWNYKTDPQKQDPSWGESEWTDFYDFDLESLKMCVEIADEKKAEQLKESLPQCDSVRFSEGDWYKYTRKGVTKEQAITLACSAYGIECEDIVAFGDDYADIGMLKLAGIGVAMGNAIHEVKKAADVVIGSNEEDGIAKYLEESYGTN